jgi:hypothetical protein
MIIPASVASLPVVTRVDMDGPQPNIQGLDLTGMTITSVFSVGATNVQTWPIFDVTVNVTIERATGILGIPAVRRATINDSIVTELRAGSANPSLLELHNVTVTNTAVSFASTGVPYLGYSLLPQSQWPGLRAYDSTFTNGIAAWSPNHIIVLFERVTTGSLAPHATQTIYASFLDSTINSPFRLAASATASRLVKLDMLNSQFDGFEGPFGVRLAGLTVEDCSQCTGVLPTLPESMIMLQISDTSLTGPLSISPNVISYVARRSRFNGTIPTADIPASVTTFDVRSNLIDLCTGLPQMGPKFPSYVPLDSIYIFPQQIDVTCYCVAGSCLSGNAFPAHYGTVPATYADIECVSAPPVPGTPCWLGFWTIGTDFAITSQLEIGNPISVRGGLQVSGGGNLQFSTIENPILVTGDVDFDNGNGAKLEVIVDDYMVETLLEKEKKARRIRGPSANGEPETFTITVPLIRSDTKIQTTNPDDIPLLVTQREGMCNQVTGSQAVVLENSIVTLFTISTGGCNSAAPGTPGNSKSNMTTGTIALIAIGCVVGLAVIIVIIVILVSTNDSCRKTVRPYEGSRT